MKQNSNVVQKSKDQVIQNFDLQCKQILAVAKTSVERLVGGEISRMKKVDPIYYSPKIAMLTFIQSELLILFDKEKEFLESYRGQI